MSSYYAEQKADRARFLRETKDHRMTILQDEGIYRHIHVGKPGSSNRHFNITTVPGYLMYTGDMGSYVFSRCRDMFEFHRLEDDCWNNTIGPNINYDYWAEKAQAVDKHVGLTSFDEDAFKEACVREFREWDYPPKARLFYDFRHDVIEVGYERSSDATHAVMDWSFHNDKYEKEWPFHEFYEFGPFTKPSYHLKWACWAIAHTIRDYDRGGDRFNRQEEHDHKVLGVK